MYKRIVNKTFDIHRYIVLW